MNSILCNAMFEKELFSLTLEKVVFGSVLVRFIDIKEKNYFSQIIFQLLSVSYVPRTSALIITFINQALLPLLTAIIVVGHVRDT